MLTVDSWRFVSLATATCLAVSGCATAYGAVPPPNVGMSRAELEARFTTILWGEIWQNGLNLDEGAQNSLQDIARVWAEKTQDRGERDIPLAEENLRRVVYTINEESKKSRSGIISKALVDKVRESLGRICPLYPFC